MFPFAWSIPCPAPIIRASGCFKNSSIRFETVSQPDCLISAVLIYISWLRYTGLNLKDILANILSTSKKWLRNLQRFFHQWMKIYLYREQSEARKTVAFSECDSFPCFRLLSYSFSQAHVKLTCALEELSFRWRSKSSVSFKFLWLPILFNLRLPFFKRQVWHGNDVWIPRFSESMSSHSEVSAVNEDRSMWNEILVLSALLKGRSGVGAQAKLCREISMLSCKASRKFVLDFSLSVLFAASVLTFFERTSVCWNITGR